MLINIKSGEVESSTELESDSLVFESHDDDDLVSIDILEISPIDTKKMPMERTFEKQSKWNFDFSFRN